MKWEELKGGFSMAKVAEGEPLYGAMVGFCNRIREKVLPQQEGVEWDCIRIEFWPDSGRMIAFPSKTLQMQRIEKFGCQVVFEELLHQYEELADSELSDDVFTSALTEIEAGWIECFISAAKLEGLGGLHIQFWDCDGESPIRAIVV